MTTASEGREKCHHWAANAPGFCPECGDYIDYDGRPHPRVDRRVAELVAEHLRSPLGERLEPGALKHIVQLAEAQVRAEREAASAATGQSKGA